MRSLYLWIWDTKCCEISYLGNKDLEMKLFGLESIIFDVNLTHWGWVVYIDELKIWELKLIDGNNVFEDDDETFYLRLLKLLRMRMRWGLCSLRCDAYFYFWSWEL